MLKKIISVALIVAMVLSQISVLATDEVTFNDVELVSSNDMRDV